MTTAFKKIRVFFSSTSEMGNEKLLLEETIRTINSIIGDRTGVFLECLDYKMLGSHIKNEDGQTHINSQMRNQYDIYFGVLGQRFGSPTPTGETGTESEFNIALESYNTTNKPLLSFFFKNSPYSGDELDKVKEWAKVLEFKKKIGGKGLYSEYKTDSEFKDACQATLKKFIDVLNIVNLPLGQPQTESVSDDISSESHFNSLKRKFSNTSIVQELDGELKFPSSLIADAGLEIVRNLKYSGFVTYYVKKDDFWVTGKSPNYLGKIREKAKEGKHITRIYILENIDLLDKEQLRELLKQDLSASIITKLILEDDIGDDAAQDFGLWDCFDETGNSRVDGGLVCFVDLGGHGKPTGCRFSLQNKSIEKGISFKDALLANEKLRDAKIAIETYEQESQNKIVPNSILHEAVSKMEEIASDQCAGSYLPDGGREDDCKWYHKSWQYLRLLGMVSTPEWHHNFFLSELQKAVKDKTKVKILISGLADFGMLAYVIKACKSSILSDIHVMDRCRTPLQISHWYQRKVVHTSTIKTFQCDARETDIRDKLYDIIVTDAFLTRFEFKDRKKVLSEWNRMLKDSGVIITTIRKHLKGNDWVKANENEKNHFKNTANLKVKEWKANHAYQSHLNLDENKIEKYANEYALTMNSNKMGEEKDIRREFEENNLTIISCQEFETPGEYAETIYYQIVAKKIIK